MWGPRIGRLAWRSAGSCAMLSYPRRSNRETIIGYAPLTNHWIKMIQVLLAQSNNSSG